MAAKPQLARDQKKPRTMKLMVDDQEVVAKLRHKYNLPGMDDPDVVRLVLRRALEAESKVA